MAGEHIYLAMCLEGLRFAPSASDYSFSGGNFLVQATKQQK